MQAASLVLALVAAGLTLAAVGASASLFAASSNEIVDYRDSRRTIQAPATDSHNHHDYHHPTSHINRNNQVRKQEYKTGRYFSKRFIAPVNHRHQLLAGSSARNLALSSGAVRARSVNSMDLTKKKAKKVKRKKQKKKQNKKNGGAAGAGGASAGAGAEAGARRKRSSSAHICNFDDEESAPITEAKSLAESQAQASSKSSSSQQAENLEAAASSQSSAKLGSANKHKANEKTSTTIVSEQQVDEIEKSIEGLEIANRASAIDANAQQTNQFAKTSDAAAASSIASGLSGLSGLSGFAAAAAQSKSGRQEAEASSGEHQDAAAFSGGQAGFALKKNVKHVKSSKTKSETKSNEKEDTSGEHVELGASKEALAAQAASSSSSDSSSLKAEAASNASIIKQKQKLNPDLSHHKDDDELRKKPKKSSSFQPNPGPLTDLVIESSDARKSPKDAQLVPTIVSVDNAQPKEETGGVANAASGAEATASNLTTSAESAASAQVATADGAVGPIKAHEQPAEKLSARCESRIENLIALAVELIETVDALEPKLAITKSVRASDVDSIEAHCAAIRRSAQEAKSAASLNKFKLLDESLKAAGSELSKLAAFRKTSVLQPNLRPLLYRTRRQISSFKFVCRRFIDN